MTTYKDFGETEREFTRRIGAYIRERRQAIGKNQKQLAEAIGCSAPTVSALEFGKCRLTLHRANLCANYLGISMAELLVGGTNAHRAHVLARQVREGTARTHERPADQEYMAKAMETAREVRHILMGEGS